MQVIHLNRYTEFRYISGFVIPVFRYVGSLYHRNFVFQGLVLPGFRYILGDIYSRISLYRGSFNQNLLTKEIIVPEI